MNRDMVLWKTQSGVISLQDAYCPHMGAHLGYGNVRGELLECIFHKRTFDVDGNCRGTGKNNSGYPIFIQHNMVFAWFGYAEPVWEMPDFMTGFIGEQTSKWKIFKLKKLNYNFHPKDLLDNTVDAIHFKTFHNKCISHKPIEILESSPYHFISKIIFLGYPKLKDKHFELELVTECYGPSTLVVNSIVKSYDIRYYFKFIFLCTPISNENTNYTIALAVNTLPKRKLSLGKRIMEYIFNHYAFHMQIKEFKVESKQVWENKTYLTDPDLSQHENALQQYSTWYKQFYVKDKTFVSTIECSL
jgi:3-ketosteroid 9alpha-monooxygenase subunit A